MTDSRTSRERLDALLAGLEDEVLRSDRTGGRLADEGGGAEDVGAMRSAIESLIRPHVGDAPGAKAKVTQAMARLGRWAWVVQDGGPLAAAPRVRMAFSGKAKVGKTARKPTRRRRGESVGAEHKDC